MVFPATNYKLLHSYSALSGTPRENNWKKKKPDSYPAFTNKLKLFFG